jgi:hypothetical protein
MGKRFWVKALGLGLGLGIVAALSHPRPAFGEENTVIGRVVLPGNYVGFAGKDCPASVRYPDLQNGGTIWVGNQDGELIGQGLLLPASNVPVSPPPRAGRKVSLGIMECHALFLVKIPKAANYFFQVVSPDLLTSVTGEELIKNKWRLVIFAK